MDAVATNSALPLPSQEHGDRHAFLARATTYSLRQGGGHNAAHPLPASAFSSTDFAPLTYETLDAERGAANSHDAHVGSTALVELYARNAAAAMLNVIRCDRAVSDDQLRSLVDSEQIATAVVSKMAGAQLLGERLVGFGVSVQEYTPEAAVHADLGITEPRFGIAAIGSLVQDSTLEGGRGSSLVPRLHLALLPASRIVADTAAVLTTFRPGAMPANVVVISGPSRTGDIEMLLTVGVHGPIKVFVALVGGH